MGNKIVVQPSVLESTAQKIETQTTDYESLYKNLFNEVDGMAAVWQGTDNIAFTQQMISKKCRH
jgi:uncharacterized protein YukE